MNLIQNLKGSVPVDVHTFALFAIKPDSPLLSQQQKAKAIAFTILMGVFTLGIGQLICKIICEIRKHQLTSLVQKCLPILQRTIGGTPQEYQAALKFDLQAIAQLGQRFATASEARLDGLFAQIQPLLPRSQSELKGILVGAITLADELFRKVALLR